MWFYSQSKAKCIFKELSISLRVFLETLPSIFCNRVLSTVRTCKITAFDFFKRPEDSSSNTSKDRICSVFCEVIGTTVTNFVNSLTKLFETTIVGRVFCISLPLVGSNSTKTISPRSTLTMTFTKISIQPVFILGVHLIRRVFSYKSFYQLFLRLFFRITAYSLSYKRRFFARFCFLFKNFNNIFWKRNIHSNSTHCTPLIHTIIHIFLKSVKSLFICNILVSTSLASTPSRLSSNIFDLSQTQKIFIAPGLVSLLEFPQNIIEVRVGDINSVKAIISQTSPKELTVYLSNSKAKASNLIVRAEKKVFVFDVVPSSTNHQDYIKISGSFGSPNYSRAISNYKSVKIEPQSKKETKINIVSDQKITVEP